MRLTRVFLETDLRCAFDGLRMIAKNSKTKLEDTTVLFMNRKCTAFKMLTNNTYCIYYRNGSRRIPLEALSELPMAFGGSAMEMNEAIKKVVVKRLEARQK